MSYYGGEDKILAPVTQAAAALAAAQSAMDAALDAARREVARGYSWRTDMADVAKAAGISRATAFRWADRARAAAESQKLSTPASEHIETAIAGGESQK